MKVLDTVTAEASSWIEHGGKESANGARNAAGTFVAYMACGFRFCARHMGIVCERVAWVCPILLVAELPIAGSTIRLVLWITCDLFATVLASAPSPEDREPPYIVYLSAACGLIATLVIAVEGF